MRLEATKESPHSPSDNCPSKRECEFHSRFIAPHQSLMLPRALWHYLAALYFAFQSLCAAFWWLILALEPRARPLFRPANTPDSALFAFFLPDALLFIGAALWAAARLVKNPRAARLPLVVHIGGAVYAALYCIAQTLLTGEAILATVLMVTCALFSSFLGWKTAFASDS